MKIKDTLEKITSRKHLIVLLVAGIVIMIVPDLFNKGNELASTTEFATEKIDEIKLEKILKNVDGVADADIFITYKNNGRNNYAYDVTSDNNRQEIEIKMSDDNPVITGVSNPEIKGILVVVKGKSLNKIDLSNIIKAATGVPLHRICVNISEGD